LDPNIHTTCNPRRGGRGRTSVNVFQRKLTFASDKFSLDMQRVRFELILELKTLAEMAQQKAVDTHPAKRETKQDWARLAAYISQVINGIGKTYEEIKIDVQIEELQKKVAELVRRRQEKDQQENEHQRQMQASS